MKFFPESTLKQIEFDKIKVLLTAHCRMDMSREKAMLMPVFTKKETIELALRQTSEYKTLTDAGEILPSDFTFSISKELKLLSVPGATLTGEQFLMILRLYENFSGLFRWFNPQRREGIPALADVIKGIHLEKTIKSLIEDVLDNAGIVKDTASEELASIRTNLYRRRNELRKVFDRIVGKLNKLGYLADIEESFMNGRRVLAVTAENKRMIRGILHGESDSRRTTFIEPEETTELNNAIFSLEYEEGREINRILRDLTGKISVYAPLLQSYYSITSEFDFIRAKAKLARDYNGQLPELIDKAIVKLVNAVHPLLYLYNKAAGKSTIPVNLSLNSEQRILVISGPNAGGKTVTLKTVGLLQVMLQAGLLVPASADSQMGIFKQLMIHIGDTQSLEFELSTYSSQLKNMKHFIEQANGKTLFFIDELGSGSDPNLGGAFAEVIMEELAYKHAMGIVTTHYLNLKIMANKVKGIVNGAMQFDEKNLLPLYKLQIGKPGSSYTFAIAERIGLDKKLIDRARTLVDEEHFRLDKLLNSTEQDMQKVEEEKKQLQKLLQQNDELRKQMKAAIEKENHRQEMELIQQRNKVSDEKLTYLKDMERKLKAIINEWRKAEDKNEAIKTIQSILFVQKQKMVQEKQYKGNDKFEEIKGEIKIGDKVKMKQNRQVGIVKQIKGKKAILQVGVMPMTVAVADLVLVKEK